MGNLMLNFQILNIIKNLMNLQMFSIFTNFVEILSLDTHKKLLWIDAQIFFRLLSWEPTHSHHTQRVNKTFVIITCVPCGVCNPPQVNCLP